MTLEFSPALAMEFIIALRMSEEMDKINRKLEEIICV